jgi:hypothetical protein
LGFHDSFHVGRPSVFAGDEGAWGFVESLRDLDFFDFFVEDFFAEIAESFERGFLFLKFFFFVFGLVEFESFFGGVSEFVSIEVFQLLEDVLIDGVDHVDDFVVFFSEGFDEW